MNEMPMPQMPQAPQEENKVPIEMPQAPAMDLGTPDHGQEPVKDVAPTQDEELFKKPDIVNPELNNNSTVKLSETPVGGIKVVALREGFYNNRRLQEGAPFSIRSIDEFGSWFRCEDSEYEKLRVKLLNEKKQASKMKADAEKKASQGASAEEIALMLANALKNSK